MFRDITRKKQELPFEEVVEILKKEKRGVLSVMGDEGYPYGMPINYWYDEESGNIYFHSGKKGHKVDAITSNNKVSFCVYNEGYKKEGDWALNISSVIVFGKIYVIEDDCGAAAKVFMSTVRKTVLEHGFDIISCRCSVFPGERTEHIFVPELRLGFMTKNRRHGFDILPYRTLHSKRFYDDKKYLCHKHRIKFALRCASSLIAEASKCMAEAKKVHDELEEIYINAMNFSDVDMLTEKILSKI